ncbi:MAG: hypothetical protein HOP91_07445 [Sphingomonas sp.]|nr:hypothetical protein [Sphingomonas sp.]
MLRERVLVLRLRADVLRGLAAALGLAALERLAAGFEDFARVEAAFLAPLLRVPVDRFAVDDRVPVLRDEDEVPRDEDDVEPLLEVSSPAHLPDITRCAASATASAISEPSLVALAIMFVAAWLAVSAASRPASRIARRALGLALIAAAAAARPAASISLLIAALAILSTVSLPDVLPEELLFGDLAIGSLPPF